MAVFTRPRQALVIASALALTFSATACSSSDSDTSDNADSPECAAYEAYQGSDGRKGQHLLVHPGRRGRPPAEQSWKQFEDCTGIEIDYEGSGEFEAQLQVRVDGGNAPDIAFIPQPGLLGPFADAGKLKAASAETKAMAEKNYSPDWLKYAHGRRHLLRRAARLQREVLRLVLAEDLQGKGLDRSRPPGTS